MSDTPRTNSFAEQPCDNFMQACSEWAVFARQLERELAGATESRDVYKAEFSGMIEDLALVQPARNAEEWGQRVSKTAMMRLAAAERELSKAVEQEAFTAKTLATVVREYAKLDAEVERWFKYVDPFDMYPEDASHYDARAALARKNTP
jgi:hypothetical protein